MNKSLWTFPVPSNCIYSGVKLVHEKTSITIVYDYYDEEDDDKVYNGKIEFKNVIAHRHTSEKFTKFIKGTYDNLCEIIESQWKHSLVELSPEWANINQLKHYAIYFESYGLYEFIANDYVISEIKRGCKDE